MKEMRDKLNKYSEYVRQNFQPEPDKKKILELKQKNKSISIPNTKPEEGRELGLKYLTYSKEHGDPGKRNEQEED